MATFAAQPPVSVTKSPTPSCATDSPYHSIVQGAQGTLMDKVEKDVGHVVNALEAICAAPVRHDRRRRGRDVDRPHSDARC